jgi:hypothetical protein
MVARKNTYRGFIELLRDASRHGSVLFLCHNNADTDSMASAFALSREFGGDVGVYDRFDPSRTLVKTLDIPVIVDPPLQNYELVVLCDARSETMFGNHDRLEKFAIIDHHSWAEPTRDLSSRSIRTLYQPVGSTCDVVFNLFRNAGADIDRDTGLALMAGILSDTMELRNIRGNPSVSLRNLGWIMSHLRIPMAEALAVINVPLPDTKHRQRLIRKLREVDERVVKGLLIASTHCDSWDDGWFLQKMMRDVGYDISITHYFNDYEKKFNSIYMLHKPLPQVDGRSFGEALVFHLDSLQPQSLFIYSGLYCRVMHEHDFRHKLDDYIDDFIRRNYRPPKNGSTAG